MRLGEGVEWALHSCTILALLPPETRMPASRLAEFHGVPAAYLAKHLQQLSAAGIVESSQGRKGGYRLARPPADITLLEVVEAVDGSERSFRCTEIRQRGPSAVAESRYSPVCGIAKAMYKADAAWRSELRSQTVADVFAHMTAEADPEAASKALVWFRDAVRWPRE